MSNPFAVTPPRPPGARVLGVFLALFVSGCNPEGTGTVSVKDRGKIQESLLKGSKVTLGPDGKPAKTDDIGVKFRNKSKAD